MTDKSTTRYYGEDAPMNTGPHPNPVDDQTPEQIINGLMNLLSSSMDEVGKLREQLRHTTAVQPEDVMDRIAEILMNACQGPKAQMHPWRPFDFYEIAGKIISVTQTAHPIDGMTLPKLPDGWFIHILTNKKNVTDEWYVELCYEKPWQIVGHNGPTPRAAVLAAIAAIEGDKK